MVWKFPLLPKGGSTRFLISLPSGGTERNGWWVTGFESYQQSKVVDRIRPFISKHGSYRNCNAEMKIFVRQSSNPDTFICIFSVSSFSFRLFLAILKSYNLDFFSQFSAIMNHIKPHIVCTEPKKKARWAVNLLGKSNCLMGFPL